MGRMTSKWCPQIFLADDDPIAHCSVKVLLIKETRLANDIVSLIRFVQGKKEQAKVHVVIPCFCTKSWLLHTVGLLCSFLLWVHILRHFLFAILISNGTGTQIDKGWTWCFKKWVAILCILDFVLFFVS